MPASTFPALSATSLPPGRENAMAGPPSPGKGQPAMNPAGVFWPVLCPDPVTTVTAQRRRRDDGPVIILNP